MKLDPEKFDFMRYLRPRPKSEEEKRYGTFNRRMMAATIDSMLISLILAPLVDLMFIHVYGAPEVNVWQIQQQAGQEANPGEAMRTFFEGMQNSGYLERWATNMRWQFYAFAIYTTICWHYWAATPGKMLCRLKIIDAKTGGPMGDWQSILRLLGYIVSALPLGLGFFWISFNKKRKGWHDHFAGTEVILVPRKSKTTSAPEADHRSDSPAPSEAE